jgi:hypothetical protein
MIYSCSTKTSLDISCAMQLFFLPIRETNALIEPAEGCSANARTDRAIAFNENWSRWISCQDYYSEQSRVPSGAISPGVSLTLINVGTGHVRTQVTADAGQCRYLIWQYTLQDPLQGFVTRAR